MRWDILFFKKKDSTIIERPNYTGTNRITLFSFSNFDIYNPLSHMFMHFICFTIFIVLEAFIMK